LKLKITCTNPKCGKKFEFTYFREGIVPSGSERDPNTGEQLFEEEKTCTCPYCNWLIYREDIDDSELMDIETEEVKRENPEDQEDFEEQETDQNE
jgi:hypothetical protein